MLYECKTITLKNGATARLRSPTPRDAAAMVRFLRGCAEETPFLLRNPEECDITVSQERAFLRDIDRSPYMIMILCEVDSDVAGNCQLALNRHQKTRHRASIAIALRQKYWRLGIGTALMEELIRLAREAGVTQLELEYVEGNDRARGLYDKMGFVPYGERPDSIRLPDGRLVREFMMRKCL